MTSHKVLKLTDFNFTKSELHEGLITPQLAAEILELNWERNRNMQASRIVRYAQQMATGNWMASSAIQFSTEGKLIQGQHRMNAVIKCGQAQPFYVQTGCDPKCAEVLDQGRSRTAMDIAVIRGVKKLKTAHIAIMRMAIFAANPTRTVSHSFSPAQIVQLCEIYYERLDFCLNHAGSKAAVNFAPVLTAVFVAYPYENHKRLDEFLYCWQKGLVLNGACDNSAIVLRNDYYKDTLKNASDKYRLNFFRKAQLALKKFLVGEYSKVHRVPINDQWKFDELKYENLIKKIQEFH